MMLRNEEATAFIGLGANKGRRLPQLRAAVCRLDAHSAVRVVATSPVYETEAHTLDPNERQPAYLNAVVQVETTLAPETLLDVCQQIERAAGRNRSSTVRRWAPRFLDLDMLTYDGVTLDTPVLMLPHPRLAGRRFVLQPWADLAPNLRVPAPFDATVAELLAHCSDTAPVRRTEHTLVPPTSVTT